MQTTKQGSGARRQGRSAGASQRPWSGSKSSGSKRGGQSRRRSGGGRSHRGGGKRRQPSFNPSQFINTNPVEYKEEVYTPTHAFRDMDFDPRIVERLTDMGIITPSPIQDQIIPEILKGHDVIGLAETGTGKTAAFLIPVIDATIRNTKRSTIILAPTRELAMQIDDEFRKIAKGMKLSSAVCVGGINIRPQIKALRQHQHFIIGTPGRVLDLMNRKLMPTRNIKTVILDEADRMLDMGFIGDMKKILKNVPKEGRETLFFSATMSPGVKNLVHDFLNKPITVSVKKTDVTNSIEQNVVMYKESEKFDKLVTLLKSDEVTRAIIFGAMKHSVERLSRDLSQVGVPAASIHGNKTHPQRQRALKDIKQGRVEVLVATDVAARGIHVDDVSHVINYDLPQTFEDYVHRIGRTGRGTKRGKALTFVPENAMKKQQSGGNARSSHGGPRRQYGGGSRTSGGSRSGGARRSY